MRNLYCLALFLFCGMVVSDARAASYEFSWTGSDGYWLDGAFSIPDALTNRDYIDEQHVSCFRIKGYQGKTELGKWSLGDVTPETHWNLNFEPNSLQFRTGGNSFGTNGQEWNMNGFGVGCGRNGFGFNAGGAAQDICIDNKFISSSKIPANTPLKATRNDDIRFSANDCNFDYVS